MLIDTLIVFFQHLFIFLKFCAQFFSLKFYDLFNPVRICNISLCKIDKFWLVGEAFGMLISYLLKVVL